MIIEQTHSVATNLQNSTEFSVSNDSAKIFSFLSNFLYKDKERSVITELCSNALDAHKALGKESTPIKVCLPTDLQKEFKVRDFGTGLSEAQIYEFLTKYGSSSKGKSNDFIGGFGIGSKSPAAVTDTWTVNSYHDGFETSYLIHVNDRGIPSINKLFSKPTTETGLEVIVPTKNTHAWHQSAEKVFEHYDVVPEIKGSQRKFSNITFEFNYNDLVKFRARSTTSYPSVHILLNRRSYELDMSKVGSESPFKATMYIPFPTSSLSVSLSREDLQYDSRTTDAIKERFEKIWARLSQDWKHEVSNAVGIFDYQLAASAFKKKYLVTTEACAFFAKTHKDKHADEVDFSNLGYFTLNMGAHEGAVQYCDGSSVKVIKNGRYGVGANNVSFAPQTYGSKLMSLSFVCQNKANLTFVLRDEKDAPSRVRNAISKGLLSHAILMDKEHWDIIPDGFSRAKASDYDKVVIVREKRVKVDSELFERVGNHFERMLTTNLDQSVTYVAIKFTSATTVASICDSFDAKFANGDWSAPIVYYKDPAMIPTWMKTTTAKELIESKYNELFARKQDIIDSSNAIALKNMYMGSLYATILTGAVFKNNMGANTVAGKIIAEVERIKAVKKNLTDANDLNILNKTAKLLGKPLLEVEMKNFSDELLEAYPMLKFASLHGWYDSSNTNTILAYMMETGK